MGETAVKKLIGDRDRKEVSAYKYMQNNFQKHNTSSSLLTHKEMVYDWIPPTTSTLKIHVHGTFSNTLSRSINDSGIRVVYRDMNGDLKLLTVGTILYLTPLGNQLQIAHIALLHA